MNQGAINANKGARPSGMTRSSRCASGSIARTLVASASVWTVCGLAVWSTTPAPHAASLLAAQQPSSLLYSPDPHHLWNRVHHQLHVRVDADGAEFGGDEIDPLLWTNTTYLLTGPSHTTALAVLDEFLATHGERLIVDPLKRAVFQHDLWAVFDWATARTDNVQDARLALATRLARVIRRVALTRDQITNLPDNYAAAVHAAVLPARYDPQRPTGAFLPADFFDADGPWVNINDSFIVPVAGAHAAEFSHSEFLVLLNVPGGVQATLDYFQTLWAFTEPYLAEDFRDGQQSTRLNPMLPQFPVGTTTALVRRMLLIDDMGRVQRSPLVESVELRVYHAPTTRGFLPDGRRSFGDQDVAAIRTLRQGLFAGDAGGFRAIVPGERRFGVFSTQGEDAFENGATVATLTHTDVLKGCVSCHAELNVQSLGIVRHLLKPFARLDYRHPRWSVYAQPAIVFKEQRPDWGLLNGLWAATPR